MPPCCVRTTEVCFPAGKLGGVLYNPHITGRLLFCGLFHCCAMCLPHSSDAGAKPAGWSGKTRSNLRIPSQAGKRDSKRLWTGQNVTTLRQEMGQGRSQISSSSCGAY